MPLTDVKIRNAKPRATAYRLTDGEGMFLLVHPNGGKYWRFKYRFQKRERILAFGVYPDVSIADARERRAQARKALAGGSDPAGLKRDAKRRDAESAQQTFETVGREWYKQNEHRWTSRHSATVLFRLERHMFVPQLKNRPIAAIEAPELLAVLRVIEASGALDLAHRVMQVCGQIFMYAVATGRAARNPVPDLRGALKAPVRNHHSYLKADDLPEYLEKLKNYDGELQTRLALRLLLLTFVRTIELRGAEWKEIDFDKAEWRIPAERMKMKDPHIVPLSRQAVGVLRELENCKLQVKRMSWGATLPETADGRRLYIFPNEHNPETFMSENTMLYALYRMGYRSQMTVHGFRSTASTILNEQGFMPDVIERQLAHGERNKVRAAYNHAQYLPERRRMVQWWADYLDDPKKKDGPAQDGR